MDFSVSIAWGAWYLGVVMAGQMLFTEGQQQLQQIVGASEMLEHSETAEPLDQATVVDPGKLQTAANEIVGLANAELDSTLGEVDFAVAAVGTVLGRLDRIPGPSGNAALAPLLADIRKPLLLTPVELVKRRILLKVPVVTHNVTQGDAAANPELLGDCLDHLLPCWSRRVDPKELFECEDMMIDIVTNEAVQFGRDISQIVTCRRGRRYGPTNRYRCQVYCERLLVRVHDLFEPVFRGEKHGLVTLLNEVEKSPSSFLALHKAALYLMWSESYFARKFKKRIGLSFIHYVTAERLECVKFVLIHTDKPVLRIAAELDFTPPNYLSRQFKRHIGVTPSEYRREHSGRVA